MTIDPKHTDKLLSIHKEGGSGYFTRAQVDELQCMLKLDDHETARMVASAITDKLYQCRLCFEAQKNFPYDDKAKKRLRKIAQTAERLASLLCEEPDTRAIIGPPPRSEHREGARGTTLGKIREMTAWPDKVLAALHSAAERANRQAEDQNEFVYARLLPPDASLLGRGYVETKILWPFLFDLWADVRTQPAWTENGPLHRFLKFVHQVGDLPEPRSDTMRGVIETWKDENTDPDRSDAPHGGK
jgi:hypothetical protein